MTGEVIQFRGVTRLDLDPDQVLEATKGELKNMVIIGWDKNDDFWFSSTMADGGDVMWLINKALYKLASGDYS
jgi:hypothetical protein